MSTQSFFDKYNGKFIDYDGVWGFQCTDLMRKFIKEVVSWEPYVAIPQTGAAKNIFKNFPDSGNQCFLKIFNGPTNSPKEGDIVFYKTSWWWPFLYGWAGHVEIVSSANSMSLITFSQNWPTGSPCKFINRKYKDCLGWLTPRK